MLGLSLLVAAVIATALFIVSHFVPVRLFTRGRRTFFLFAGTIASIPLVMGAMAFEVLAQPLPAQAPAGAAIEIVIGAIPSQESEQNFSVSRLSIAAAAALNGVATNNVTFTFKAYTAGVGRTLGTLTLAAGTNLAADTENVVAVTAAAVAAGDVITLLMTQNGTGLAVAANNFVAKVEIQ